MIKKYHFIFLLVLGEVLSQEVKVFTINDFDLRGDVKTCQVITDYGQEIFEFDTVGRLVKTTTQYNEEDRDITSYTFENNNLVEKRLESYKNNTIDLSSSMVHFFTIDTIGKKTVKEKIISYDKEFLEAQEYQYDNQDNLVRIIISHENAVDEIRIETTNYKNEKTTTYFENGIIQKSIRESLKKNRVQGELKVVLKKNYLDGEPHTAVEEISNSKGLMVSEESFQYDLNEKQFIPFEKHWYAYNTEGILSKETIEQGNSSTVKEYIFQFDDNLDKNWVKKITTPDNIFITRK